MRQWKNSARILRRTKINAAISNMKCNKNPGMTGLSMDMIKKLTQGCSRLSEKKPSKNC